MEIGFDVISDLNLTPDESFNWEGKVTSLYCIVAGNISSDLRTIWQTLLHLGRLYQGVFYVIGSLEYSQSSDIEATTKSILRIGTKIPNVAILHHHVVILDGLALVGVNGWSSDQVFDYQRDGLDNISHKLNDARYLKNSIAKLQKHLDVKKIVVVSNAVPKQSLYFGENPNEEDITLDLCLSEDTEMKVSHWVFGSYKKIVDTTIDNINYINNPYNHVRPYWAKRLNVEI